MGRVVHQRLLARIERLPQRCLSCAPRAVQDRRAYLEVGARDHVTGRTKQEVLSAAAKDGFTAARNMTPRDHRLIPRHTALPTAVFQSHGYRRRKQAAR
jgi:hypothetical protein